MKVKSVRRVILDTPVPVFDLTVHGPENFKLHNGPVVHNSKDCSDALAGVAFGLAKRREVWGLYGIKTLNLLDGPKLSGDTMNSYTGVTVNE